MAAPWGLGWLLFTGTLPDARGFYCPSARDVGWVMGENGSSSGIQWDYGERDYGDLTSSAGWSPKYGRTATSYVLNPGFPIWPPPARRHAFRLSLYALGGACQWPPWPICRFRLAV